MSVHPVLSRQRLDVPPDALAAPAPVAPPTRAPVAFIALDRHSPEVALVSRWMNRPHLAATWEYPHPEAWWREHVGAQAEGTYSRPFLVTVDGTPAGYAELYRPAQDSIGATYDADPYDLGVHIALGEPDDTGRGLGPLLLAEFLPAVWRTQPLCRRVMVDPDHRNSAARKLVEKSGARFLGIHEMSNRTMALYAFERPTDTETGDTA